jgi:hypothetical protein
MWFDTVLHNPLSLELLIRTVGADRCLFGTERPGSGTAPDGDSGRDFDDIRPVIEGFGFLDDNAKQAVLSGNALSLFRLATAPAVLQRPVQLAGRPTRVAHTFEDANSACGRHYHNNVWRLGICYLGDR